MNGSAKNGQRLLHVTAGNVRQSHLYVGGHFDFFPPDVVGGAKQNGASSNGIEIFLDGLNETVTTDIGRDSKTGKPRRFFRGRSWVRRFFEYHAVQPGAILELKRVATRKYRLSVSQTQQNGKLMRAAEFFAGIGLVRLALERQGWEVVFANDIDPDKETMYRHGREVEIILDGMNEVVRTAIASDAKTKTQPSTS